MTSPQPAALDHDMVFLILYLAMAPVEWRDEVFETLLGYAVIVGQKQNKKPTIVLSEQRQFLAETLRSFVLELTLRLDLAMNSPDEVEEHALAWLLNELGVAAGLEKRDA